MRRIAGVHRPGLAAVIPPCGGPLTLIDCGANIDRRAEMLLQFAHMGACFAEDVLGRRAPRVGLLSIGEEPGKGNQLTKEVFELLAAEAGLDFAGNIEGRDLLGQQGAGRRHRRVHGQRRAEDRRGHGDRDLQADARPRPSEPARPWPAGCCCAAACATCARASTPRPTAGRSCSASRASPSRRTDRRRGSAIANACRMAAEGVRHDVCGHVAARVGARRPGRAAPDV